MITLHASPIFSQGNRKMLQKADQFYLQFNYQQALDSYLKAAHASSKEAIVHYNIANSYYRLGVWEKALEEYQTFVSEVTKSGNTDPTKRMQISDALHNMGNTFMQLHQIENAIEAYKEALRVNFMNEDSRYNLAVAQKLLSDQQSDAEITPLEEQANERQQDPSQQPQNMPKENIEQILKAIEAEEAMIQNKVLERQNNQQKNNQNQKNW